MRSIAGLGRLCCQSGPLESLDLGELCHEAATEARVLFKGRPVEYHLQEVMPIVVTQRAPLYQVLSQLLRNSFQASRTGQTLVIEIGARRVETGGVELRIGDTGKGMSDFLLAQVRATITGESGGGSGLGLVLVRQVVAGWRGAVRIRSEPDQGTVVTILARTL